MINEKINTFLDAPDDSINLGKINEQKLSDNIYLYWGEEIIGQLSKGSKIYLPIAEAIDSEFISSETKLLISAKLQNWIDTQISIHLSPLREKLEESLNSNVRAIAFNCFENLGTLEIESYKDFISNIDLDNKQKLAKLGIRIGAKYFFMPNLMKKKSIELNSLLWKLFNSINSDENIPIPLNGRVSFTSKTKMPISYWQSIGYICIKNFAFRIDVFEKVFYLARKKIKNGPFLESADLMNPIGCNSEQLKDIMIFCGYEQINLPDQKKLYFFKKNKLKNKIPKKNKIKKKLNVKKEKISKPEKKLDPNSPFAVLEKLL